MSNIEAEKRLWKSVMATAINDSFGRFSYHHDLDEQFERVMEKLKVKRDKAEKGIKAASPSVSQFKPSLDTSSARAWFKGRSRDFKKVCEFADIPEDTVYLKMTTFISKIEAFEKFALAHAAKSDDMVQSVKPSKGRAFA